jgi:hypothetical protein
MTSTYLAPITTTAFGLGLNIRGSLDLINGRILSGTKEVLLGMISTNLGGRFLGLNSKSHSKLMKCSLGAGTVAVGMQGALRLGNGVKQKSVAEIIGSGIQTAVGIAGTAFIYSLDSRMIMIAHQASVIALPSTFIVKLGFQDLANSRYPQGLCKILLGIGGVASAGYYVYSEYFHHTLSADQIAFLEANEEEIEDMHKYGGPSGNWDELGKGVSKKAYVHPDFPGMLIKIPRCRVGIRGSTGEDDLRIHHRNLEQIRPIAAAFDRIVLPESHLYTTMSGKLMIVEQKLNLVRLNDVSWGPDRTEAEDQFNAFEEASGLCDLNLRFNPNAGMIPDTFPQKIGIIDFDCRYAQQEVLTLKNDTQTWNRQASAAALAAGTAVLSSAAMIANKITEINPIKILELGFAVGAITYYCSCPDTAAAGTGLAMAGTSVVTIAAIKAYSLVKNYLAKFILYY